MLSRTLRHSRSPPSRAALSLGPQRGQIAHIHSTPFVAAAKSAAQPPPGSPIAKKGWREKTVVELKAELKRRGLPITGKKEEVHVFFS